MKFEGHHKIQRFDSSSSDAWHPFKCAHCNKEVSGAVIGFYKGIKWIICPICGNGSVLTLEGNIYPGIRFGPNIKGLPEDISDAYNEARSCISINAFTSSELMCRKILMHVAVEKGAKEGEKFTEYLLYLEKQGFITPPMKEWVDLIRQHGNIATHKLETPEKERAESTLMFTAELLRLIYEMEFLAKTYGKKSKENSI